MQYDEKEVLSLWEKVQSEPVFLQTPNPGFTDYTNPNNGKKNNKKQILTKAFVFSVVLVNFRCVVCAAKKRILSNLEKHPTPCPPPELQQYKAPVADIPTNCFTDSKAATELLQQDLSILQDQARYMDSTH